MGEINEVKVDLGKGGFAHLGLAAYDYQVGSDAIAVDYETLALGIAKARAHVLEAEITPLATKMQTRNDELELLGDALSRFTEATEQFESDAEGSATTTFSMSPEMYSYLLQYQLISRDAFTYHSNNATVTATKSGLAGASEAVKTKMDGLNNAAQLDMTRLESLVARRDEAFEAASDFRSSISDSRDTFLQSLR